MLFCTRVERCFKFKVKGVEFLPAVTIVHGHTVLDVHRPVSTRLEQPKIERCLQIPILQKEMADMQTFKNH